MLEQESKRIYNETLVTRKLMGKLCFANMFHRMKYTMLLFPLLAILASLIFTFINPDLQGIASIVISISVALPVFVVAINVIVFNVQMRGFPKEGSLAKFAFCQDGFYVNPNDEARLIDYEYILECVEFSKIYVIYFVLATPIAIEKSGFKEGNPKEFTALMKKVIMPVKKRRKIEE